MATANTSDIANAEKAKQDNEAKNRGDVETVPLQRADDGQIENQPQGEHESAQPERVIVEAPPAPTRLSREDIYKRFSEKRQSEAIETDGYSPTTPPPFLAKDTPSSAIDDSADGGDGEHELDNEVKPAAEAVPAVEAPKKFKIKVRQNEYELTREQLIQAAELSPEDAEGVPETSLVRAAQLVQAGKSYLDEARETSRNARVRKATPAEADDDEPDDRQPVVTPPKVTTKEVVEKIQFEAPEDAAALLDGLINDRVDERLRTSDQQRASRSDQQRVLQAEADWNKANPEFAKDPALNAAHSAYFLEEAVNELAAKTGLVTQEIAQHLRQNPNDLAAAYKKGMQSGFDLKPVEALMMDAGERTKKRFGITSADPAAQRAQEPPARQQPSREDLKRKLAATPERSGGQEPASQNQAPTQRNASQVIRDMRKARGQPVAG